MVLNANSLVSITEVNQNFSKVAHLVDKTGSAIVLKNNKPRYVILEYAQLDKEIAADNEVLNAAQKIIQRHLAAFKELAQ
jgi:antitoxin Phd